MAVTLESLVLDFQADFSKFDSQLNAASKKAEKAAKSMEKRKISLQVDDSALSKRNDILNSAKIKQKIEHDLKLAVTNNQSPSDLRQLTSIAGEIAKSTKDFTKEQRKTTRAIETESAVSVGNFIKGQLVSGTFSAVKNTAVKELGVDTKALEKFLNKVAPSTKMIGQDVSKVVKGFGDLTGSTKNFKTLVDRLSLSLADSTQNASSLKDVFSNFTASAGQPVQEYIKKLQSTKDEILNDPNEFKAKAGLTKQDLPETLAKLSTVRSVSRSAAKILEPKVKARKERLQNERLPNILDRALELAQEDVGKVRKDTGASRVGKNVLKSVDNELQELVLVISGHTDNAKVGMMRASQVNKELQNQGKLGKSVAVGIDNPDVMIGKGHSSLKESMSVARPNIRGYSKDAEEMAAQAVAALNKNPELTVKLVGESGGGLAVEEAVQILNKLGYGGRVQGAGFGTPDMIGKTTRSKNFKAYLGINEDEALGDYAKKLVAPLGFMDSRFSHSTRPSTNQSMRGLEGHTIDNYYPLDEFTQFVYGTKGKKQERIKPKEFDDLRASITQSLKNDTFSLEGNQFMDVRDGKRISGGSVELFAELEKDLADLEKDLVAGVLEQARKAVDGVTFQAEENNFDELMEAGDLEFFQNLVKDIEKTRLLLKKLDLSASVFTKEVIKDLSTELEAFSKLTPQTSNENLLKAKGFIKNSDNLLPTDREGLETNEELLDDLNNIEPGLQKQLATLKVMGSSSEQEQIKKQVEKQLKTIRLIRLYVKKGLDFDYEDLVSDPSAYLQALKTNKALPDPSSDPWGNDNQQEKLDKVRKKIPEAIEEVSEPGVKTAYESSTIADVFEEKPQASNSPKLAVTIEQILAVDRQILSNLQTVIGILGGFDNGGIIGIGDFPTGGDDDTPLYDVEVMGSDETNLVRKSLNVFGKSVLDATRTLYKASHAAESFAFAFLPGAGIAKKGLQTAAIPAAIGAAGIAVPGLGGAMLEGVGLLQGALMPVFQAGGGLLGAGVEAAVINGVNTIGTAIAGEVVSTLPMIGGGLSSAIVGALPEVGATLGAGAAAATGSAVVAGGAAATVAVPAVMISKAVSDGVSKAVNKLTGSTSESTQQAQLVGSSAANQVKGAATKAVDIVRQLELIKTEITPFKQLKKLPTQERTTLAQKEVKLLESVANEATRALVESEKGSKLRKAIVKQKQSIVGLLNSRVNQLKKDGVEVVVDIPSVKEVQMRRIQQVDTSGEGQNFSDGFTDNIDRNQATAFDSGLAFGKAGIKGLKKGIDSHSPSKKTKKEGDNYADGLILQIHRRKGDAEKAGKDFGVASLKGLRGTLSNTDWDTITQAQLEYKTARKNQANYQAEVKDLQSRRDLGEDISDNDFQHLIGGVKYFQARAEEIKKTITETTKEFRQLKSQVSPKNLTNGVGIRVSQSRDVFSDENITQAGQKTGQAARKGYDGLKQIINQTSLGQNLAQAKMFFDAFKEGFMGIGKQSRKAKSELAAIATGAALLVFGRQILSAARNLGMLALELDRINLKLNAIGQGGNDIFAKFGDSANRAGSSVQQYADTYASMYSSLKGKVVNPDALVSDLTIGLANRGVVGEGQQRALTAISQMASKGKVSMEELRQQLGEALPGTMTIAAEAMGVTEAKFMSMVSSGQVVSSQFLPKFAEELNNVAGETKSLNKEVARLGNLTSEIKAGAIDNLPLTQGLKLLNDALNLVKGTLKPVSLLLTGLATVAIANLVWQGIQAAMAIKAVSAALTTMGGAMAATLPYLAIAVGGFIALNSLIDSFGGNTKKIRDVNKELKSLAGEGLSAVEQKTIKYKTKNISRFGDSIANLLGRESASQRELRKFTENLGDSNQILLDLSIKFKSRITPEAIAQVKEDIQQDLAKIDSLSYQINNREAFDLSKEETLDLQKQVDDLTSGVEAKIALKFKPAELDAVLKEIDKLEKEIAQKREQGASDAEIGTLEAELTRYKREIEAMRNQVKALQTMTSPVMSNLREYRAASNSQQAQLEIAKIERLTESYGQLASMKAYSGTIAANATVDNLKGIEAEIASLDNLKRKAQETYGALNSSQKEDLANMLGTDDFSNLSKEQIEKAKQELEARKEAVGSVDPYIEAAIEALEGMEDLTRKEKQLALEKLQAQTEIFNATRDLKQQMGRMVVDNFAKEIEAKKLSKELNNRGNSLRDGELFNAGSNFRNQQRQNESNIRQQQRAFDDFVRGIQRAAEDLRSATSQLALEVGKMDLSSLSSAISGLNNYAKAAGIQDTLGLSAIRDSVAQAIGISASDNRHGIKLDISNQTRNHQRTQSDQLRQKEELNYTVNSAIAEAKERSLQLDKERLDLQDKQELSLDEMLLKVQQFNLSIQEQNRQITEANQTAGVYGVSNRVSTIAPPTFDLEAAKEQEGYAIAYLENINAQMMRSQDELIVSLEGIRSKGNREIDRSITDAQNAFNESLAASNQKLQAETRRIEVESKNLAETIKGQFHQIKKNITDGAIDLTREARQLSLELKDLYAQGGIFSRGYSPVTESGIKLGTQVDDKIAELKKRARTLEEVTNLYNGNLSRENLISEISGLKGNEIDGNLKGLILSEINSATSDKDFNEVLTKYAAQTEKVQRYARQLSDARDEIVRGGKEREERKLEVEGLNTLDDLKIKDRDLQLNKPFLSDGQTRKLNLLKEEIRLGKELRSAYESIDVKIFDGKLKTTDASKQKIELEKQYQQELENTRKKLSVMYDIGQAFQSSIEGMFSSLGDNLVKAFSGDDEIEKLKASAEYADKLREAQEKYADDPGQLSKVSERLEMLNRVKLDGIKNEFSVFGSIVGTVKNAVIDFAKAMVQMAAKIAAMKIVSSLFGGGFATGGTVGEVSNYATGGTVGGAISRAMSREGQGAQVIVAHKGEEVLTTRNNDAHFFRAIKKNGTWDSLKNNGVRNYNYGGMVGNGSTANVVKSSIERQGNTVNLTTNYNITQKGDNFGKSQSQVGAENAARQRRFYERNR